MLPSLHTTCRRARMHVPYPTQAQADAANDTPAESDSDAPADGFAALQDILDTHHAKEQRRAEESAKRARDEFENKVREALGNLDDTLAEEAGAHSERCAKLAKMAADALDRLTTSEGKLDAERTEFDTSATTLISCTKQDIETEQKQLLPRAQELAAEVDRGVASMKRLAQKHMEHHTNLLQAKAEWDTTAAEIEHTADEHAQDALRSLHELRRRR